MATTTSDRGERTSVFEGHGRNANKAGLEVLEIRNDQTAVVSTAGYYRVLDGNGRVIGEMLTLSEADAVATTYNAVRGFRKRKHFDQGDFSRKCARVMDYQGAYVHCPRRLVGGHDLRAYDKYKDVVARDVICAPGA